MAEYQTLRRTVVFLLIMAVSFSARVFAQQDSFALVEVYGEMDKAFASRSGDAVAMVLKMNQTSPSYEMLENYTLKKTRQLIIRNDLEFAREASLAVIDNNIENYDAIDLYSYIDKAILGEEQKKQAEEEQRQRELARQAALKQRTKQQIEDRGNYQTMNTTAGNNVYVNDQEQAYSPLIWTVKLGIADAMFQMVTKPESYTSFKYGLSAGADLFYPTENLVIGGDIFVDFHLLTLKGEGEIMYSARLVPMLAFANFSKVLFVRAGFGAYPLSSEDRPLTGSVDTFFTPVVGIGLGNITFGQSRFGLHADYLPGHFAYEDVKAAAEFGASVLLPLNVNEKTKIGVELGVSDVLFVKTEGIDNRVKGIFAIGVGNVQR